MLELTIIGEPIALARPRFYVRAGKTCCYNSQKAEMMQVRSVMAHQMAQCMDSHSRQTAIEACSLASNRRLAVSLDFYMPCLKSSPNRLGMRSTSKPDLDNLLKFYLDCGNGILWADDRYISDLAACKLYDETPRTVIKIVICNDALNVVAKI